jgi:uncharacterized protein with von Willebrand factor type A (vWA) domain
MADNGSIYVEYRVHWRTAGIRPGAFRGMQSGPGERFRTSVPLHARADPRRIDVRATLRDPLGGVWVRDFEQQTALKVLVLADVSASMRYVGSHDKMVQVQRIAAALARSAWRNGDAFEWLERKLAQCSPQGSSARGLLQVAARLPHRRALVFLLSDFHWPAADLDALMRRLAHHSVVPVVLWDPAEAQAIHRHGIAVLRDLESGARRFVWLRPALVESLRARRRDREAELRRICASFGSTPFFVRDRFDPIELTRYFLEALA